jgi:DNA-binding transcriptional LysR family regulator
MFDWDDLRYFLAIARKGSTTGAAKALGVSQSTVQRRLEEFEKRIGRRLVARGASGYRLTELGQAMLAYAERIDEAVLAFDRRLSASDMDLNGIIKVTCPEAVGVRLMRSTLPERFRDEFPGLHVEFVISDKLLDLAKGEADIAIRATEPKERDLFGRKIADIPWAIYASRQYLETHGPIKSVADLDRQSVALFDVELRAHLGNEWLQSAAPNARIATRCNSVAALILAVKSGIAVAALPTIVGESESDLARVLGPVPELTTHFYLLIHEDMKDTPRVRAFYDFMLRNLKQVQATLGGRKL